MSVVSGVWYFIYQEFNGMENWYPCYDVEVALKADDKDGAVVEAELLWQERLKKGTYLGYDGNTYPNSPLVRLEIFLQSTI